MNDHLSPRDTSDRELELFWVFYVILGMLEMLKYVTNHSW